MYVTITGPGSALVAEGTEATGPEDTIELDWAAMLLIEAGFNVRRVPMPDSWDDVFRSYTNAVAINNVVLVPVYPDAPNHEEEALAAFRAAYPGRSIVPIDASEVIQLDGAIHCATQTLALRDRR
jgi:agmatine deiminase